MNEKGRERERERNTAREREREREKERRCLLREPRAASRRLVPRGGCIEKAASRWLSRGDCLEKAASTWLSRGGCLGLKEKTRGINNPPCRFYTRRGWGGEGVHYKFHRVHRHRGRGRRPSWGPSSTASSSSWRFYRPYDCSA